MYKISSEYKEHKENENVNIKNETQAIAEKKTWQFHEVNRM